MWVKEGLGGLPSPCNRTGGDCGDVLFFSVAEKNLPPSVRHDGSYAHEVPYWSEAADGDVALWEIVESMYCFWWLW
jgi:hypothetical protein